MPPKICLLRWDNVASRILTGLFLIPYFVLCWCGSLATGSAFVLCFGIILFAVVFFYFFFVAKKNVRFIRVTPESINLIYEDNKKQVEINFDKIKKVNCFWRCGGGILTIYLEYNSIKVRIEIVRNLVKIIRVLKAHNISIEYEDRFSEHLLEPEIKSHQENNIIGIILSSIFIIIFYIIVFYSLITLI